MPHICQWTGLPLVQVMVYFLLGTKPLNETMASVQQTKVKQQISHAPVYTWHLIMGYKQYDLVSLILHQLCLKNIEKQ